MKEIWRNFSKSQGLGEAWNFSKSQSLGALEEARNFSKCQEYEETGRKYEEI